jgi:hypothetical protein
LLRPVFGPGVDHAAKAHTCLPEVTTLLLRRVSRHPDQIQMLLRARVLQDEDGHCNRLFLPMNQFIGCDNEVLTDWKQGRVSIGASWYLPDLAFDQQLNHPLPTRPSRGMK